MGEGVLEMGWLMGSQATEMTFERACARESVRKMTFERGFGGRTPRLPSLKRHFCRSAAAFSHPAPHSYPESPGSRPAPHSRAAASTPHLYFPSTP